MLPVIRVYLLLLFIGLVTLFAVAGVPGTIGPGRPFELFNDMDRQPKKKSQAPSDFFGDGRSDRLPVAGTVPRQAPGDPYLMSGTIGEAWGEGFPTVVDARFIERGQERYQINCAVCHGATGQGNGITTKYGLVGVASFHADRLRLMPEGQIFNTITRGYGQMGGYPHILPEDRWAIIAYIRALQYSQYAPVSELPSELQATLK